MPTSSIFRDFVERYQEIGISEFIFYWLPDERHPVMVEKGLNGVCITCRDMHNRIATEAIPAVGQKPQANNAALNR